MNDKKWQCARCGYIVFTNSSETPNICVECEVKNKD